MLTPDPKSPGIWLPMSLALPMFACYFGDAPRYENRREPARTPTPPPDVEGDSAPRGPMPDPLAAALTARYPATQFAIPRGRAPGAVPQTAPNSGTITVDAKPPAPAR